MTGELEVTRNTDLSLANIYVEMYSTFFNKDLDISPSWTLYGTYYILQPFPDRIFQRWKKTCNEELTSREKQNELLETSILLHKDKQTS